jgi:CheY-like chemotaxis protein
MLKKILIIEDNWEIRENVKEILDISNYEVITAENGQDGLEAARANEPDLILCDVMMPVMGGYELIIKVKSDEILQNIPFIFLTAKSEPGDYRRGMELGAADVVVKPFDAAELIDKIELILK